MSVQQRWAALVIDALVDAGVRDVVVSPGSRSTPFVLALQSETRVTCHEIIDERSAAFFASGCAKTSGLPALLLCTSGSAAAHYMPAVVEASYGYVPLVILSADRPHSLHGGGANQTVEQCGMFGSYVRWFADLGDAPADVHGLRSARRLAARAVALARGPHPGPVHLNARAHKPLEPEPANATEDPSAADTVTAEPVVSIRPADRAPSEDAVTTVLAACETAACGIVVCGPAPPAQIGARGAVTELARRTGFPLLAEATSQLRFGRDAAEGAPRCDAFDALFRAPEARRALHPDFILQLGPAPASIGFERLLDEHPDVRRIAVTPHGWPDPQGHADTVLEADVDALVSALLPRLSAPAEPVATRRAEWRTRVEEADACAWARVDAELDAAGDGLTEGALAREVARAVPDDGLLVVGNSLPVRQLNDWCRGDETGAAVLSQRGASGIDGLVSLAAGAATRWDAPVAALIGDVSFLHDVGGLLAARELRRPLALVIAHNDGGRIFEQLPVGARSDLVDAMPWFTTPHGLSVCELANGYRLRHARFESVLGLRAGLAGALQRPGCTVIEAAVPPSGARDQNARLREAVARCIDVSAGAVAAKDDP